MTTQTIAVCNVPANRFRAALEAAADRDVRFYLNGVLLDTERKALVATDGHCLVILGQAFENFEPEVPSFIIPRDALERVIKLTNKNETSVFVEIENRTEKAAENDTTPKRKITLRACGGIVETVEIDGKFPEYSRIVPTSPNGKISQFDPRLIALMSAAVRFAQDKGKNDPCMLHLSHNGESGPSLVTCPDPTFVGVIMPWRHEDDSYAALVRLGFCPEAKARKAA